MKHFWVIIIYTLLPFAMMAQNFRVAGRVLDGTTGEPLQGASVFAQNTTTGTVTNEEGNFRLTLQNGGYDLVISFTGLETQSIRISNTMTEIGELEIVLPKKEENLAEVSIVATTEVRNGWERYGSFLKDNFIGRTVNSKDCEIENPEALRFFFSRKYNRLRVICDSTLIIRNHALGYTIKYQLDSFVHEYNSGTTLYSGYPFYEEMEGSDVQQEKWKKKRLTAYNGSILQFMRAYHDSTLTGDGFKIEVIDDKTDKPSPIMNPYDTAFFNPVEFNKLELFFPGKLRVVYHNEKPDPAYLASAKLSRNTPVQVSIFDLGDGIIIEENGYYYDQKEVHTLGYWAWEKMADFLPYDYYPNRE